jgi:hypothetical protein
MRNDPCSHSHRRPPTMQNSFDGCARVKPSRADFSSGPPFVKPPGHILHCATAMPAPHASTHQSLRDHQSRRLNGNFRSRGMGGIRITGNPTGKSRRRTSISDRTRPHNWNLSFQIPGGRVCSGLNRDKPLLGRIGLNCNNAFSDYCASPASEASSGETASWPFEDCRSG